MMFRITAKLLIQFVFLVFLPRAKFLFIYTIDPPGWGGGGGKGPGEGVGVTRTSRGGNCLVWSVSAVYVISNISIELNNAATFTLYVVKCATCVQCSYLDSSNVLPV